MTIRDEDRVRAEDVAAGDYLAQVLDYSGVRVSVLRVLYVQRHAVLLEDVLGHPVVWDLREGGTVLGRRASRELCAVRRATAAEAESYETRLAAWLADQAELTRKRLEREAAAAAAAEAAAS